MYIKSNVTFKFPVSTGFYLNYVRGYSYSVSNCLQNIRIWLVMPTDPDHILSLGNLRFCSDPQDKQFVYIYSVFYLHY